MAWRSSLSQWRDLCGDAADSVMRALVDTVSPGPAPGAMAELCGIALHMLDGRASESNAAPLVDAVLPGVSGGITDLDRLAVVADTARRDLHPVVEALLAEFKRGRPAEEGARIGQEFLTKRWFRRGGQQIKEVCDGLLEVRATFEGMLAVSDAPLSAGTSTDSHHRAPGRWASLGLRLISLMRFASDIRERLALAAERRAWMAFRQAILDMFAGRIADAERVLGELVHMLHESRVSSSAAVRLRAVIRLMGHDWHGAGAFLETARLLDPGDRTAADAHLQIQEMIASPSPDKQSLRETQGIPAVLACSQTRWTLGESMDPGGLGSSARATELFSSERTARAELLSGAHAQHPALLDRVQRELWLYADVCRQPEHRSLPVLIDFRLDPPAVVWEEPEGDPLELYLMRHGALSADEARELFAELAEALAILHRVGLLHRGICPRSIRVTKEAAVLSSPLLAWVPPGMDLGNVAVEPRFQAPEQIRGGVADRRSDVWSLTACLYYALNFDEDPDLRLPENHVAALFPPELAEALDRGLAPAPLRYPSAVELFLALAPKGRETRIRPLELTQDDLPVLGSGLAVDTSPVPSDTYKIPDRQANLPPLTLPREVTGDHREPSDEHPPRELSADDLQPPRPSTVSESRRILLSEMEDLKTKLSDMASFHDRVRRAVKQAKRVQQQLLPEPPAGVPGLEFAVHYAAAESVSGDFYDFLPLTDDRYAVVVGDTAGHGIAPGLLMSMAKKLLRLFLQEGAAPNAALSRTNFSLYPDIPPTSFISAALGVIDSQRRTLRYTRAGHTPLLHYHADSGEVTAHTPNGIALGMDAGPLFDRSLEVVELPLGVGDVLALYTDGIIELTNRAREPYGEDRFVQSIREFAGGAPSFLMKKVISALQTWRAGSPQEDDITLVLVKVTR